MSRLRTSFPTNISRATRVPISYRPFSSTARTMSTTVRPVRKEDEEKWRTYWQAYNEFYKRTIPEEVTTHTFNRFLDDKTEMYCAVAEDGTKNEVIGFITWFPHLSTSSIKPVVYLNDLFVDPNTRSGGVGGKLIDHAYDHSDKVIGASQVYWHTQHFNHRAQLLYVKKAELTPFVKYAKTL